MQQTFLNILKKYFNVVKELADFFFCLVGYIWPKSIKDDAIKRSGLRYQIFCVVFFFFFFWIKKMLYFIIIIIIGKEIKKITLLTGINQFRNDNNTWGTQEQKR